MRGISIRSFPCSWPEKSAGDALDYSVDCSDWMADCNDSISKIAIDDVSGANVTGLTIEWAIFQNSTVSIGLSGGQPGMRYKVRIAVNTDQGRTITCIFTLPVSPMAPTVAASALTAPALTFPPRAITINGTSNT
ncbi:hypothetical protein [Komagataeibacter sp. FNDCR2]|uniref:phage fiber-tail adaptor protein n=1 Tax=Komagataeibacter sp. FNDCR2 TaxID=2878682 RepID=UPI001E34FF3A|nr:hypothetical protein [Komagataeibacter sp. FNDCR2]MCE2576014.1 hypothetical protein [Komagataeibacter sp. FNDCR2]